MRLANPIPFDAPDNENVNILVILLVPENATQEHLEILASLAKTLSNEETRAQLQSLTDAEAIYDLFNQQ